MKKVNQFVLDVKVAIYDDFVELGGYAIVRPGAIVLENGNCPGSYLCCETEKQAKKFCRNYYGDFFYRIPASTQQEWEDALKIARDLLAMEAEHKEEDWRTLSSYELLQDEFDSRR